MTRFLLQLFFAVAALAGNQLTTTSAPATASSAACSTSQIVAPGRHGASRCDVRGEVHDPEIVNQTTIASTVSDPFVACRTACSFIPNCYSFSLHSGNRLCNMYSNNIRYMDFKPNKTSHIVYSDTSCYGSNCPATTTYQPPPIPSCTAIFRNDPVPAIHHCRHNGHLKSPEFYTQFYTSNFFEFCSTACLFNASCQSFLWNDINGLCSLSSLTLDAQGFVPGNSQTLFVHSKKCLKSSCAPVPCYPVRAKTTTTVTTANPKTCLPQSTNLVQDPSFESTPDTSPWKFLGDQGGAQLVQNSPANASSGNSYASFVLSQTGGTQLVQQNITGFVPNQPYLLSFEADVVQNDNCPGSCVFQTYYTIDGKSHNAGSATLYTPDRAGDCPYPTVPNNYTYGQYLGFIKAQSPSSVLTLTLNLSCNDGRYEPTGPLQRPATVHIDDVALDFAHSNSCPFLLQMSSNNSQVDGFFMTIYGAVAFGTDYSQYANKFGLTNGGILLGGLNLFATWQEDFLFFNEARGDDFSGNYLQCTISSDGVLSCNTRLSGADALDFYYCSNCIFPNGLTLKAVGDPLLKDCIPVTVKAVYV